MISKAHFNIIAGHSKNVCESLFFNSGSIHWSIEMPILILSVEHLKVITPFHNRNDEKIMNMGRLAKRKKL